MKADTPRPPRPLARASPPLAIAYYAWNELLGTRVLRIQGRKAVLTEVGSVALRRARILLGASRDDRASRSGTWRPSVYSEIHLAVDHIFLQSVAVMPAFQSG